MENKPSRRDSIIVYSISTIMLLLIAFEIVALALWVPGTWNQKVTAVFAVVGMYGLAATFFSSSGVLKERRYVLDYLTSPHILKYITGNAIFMKYLFLLLAVASSKYGKTGFSVTLWGIGLIFVLVMYPLVFVYALFHLMVVVPITYIPTVLVSALVHRVAYSDEDFEEELKTEDGKDKLIISNIITDDPVATKGFLIGIPSLLVSMYSAIIGPFIG